MSKPAGTPAHDASPRQLVIFSLGGEEYALPIEAVSEIIRHTTLRSVVSDTPGVRGVIGLRGKIIPIVDLVARLGLATTQADSEDSGKVVVLEFDGEQIGVVVDEVDEVLTVSADQLEEVPTAGQAIDAVAKLGDRLVMLLDAVSLFADTRAVPA